MLFVYTCSTGVFTFSVLVLVYIPNDGVYLHSQCWCLLTFLVIYIFSAGVCLHSWWFAFTVLVFFTFSVPVLAYIPILFLELVFVYILSADVCLHSQGWYLFTFSVLVFVYILSAGVCLHSQCWCLFTFSVLVFVYILSDGVCLHSQCWCLFTFSVLVFLYVVCVGVCLDSQSRCLFIYTFIFYSWWTSLSENHNLTIRGEKMSFCEPWLNPPWWEPIFLKITIKHPREKICLFRQHSWIILSYWDSMCSAIPHFLNNYIIILMYVNFGGTLNPCNSLRFYVP